MFDPKKMFFRCAHTASSHITTMSLHFLCSDCHSQPCACACRRMYEAVGRLGDVTGCFLRRQGGATADDVRAAIAGLEDARCDAFSSRVQTELTSQMMFQYRGALRTQAALPPVDDVHAAIADLWTPGQVSFGLMRQR